MNKTELIAQVAEKTGTTRKDAEQVITTMLEVIGEELAAGGRVQLVGFGAFETKHREPRIGRNPRYHRARVQGRQGAEGKDRQVNSAGLQPQRRCPLGLLFCIFLPGFGD